MVPNKKKEKVVRQGWEVVREARARNKGRSARALGKIVDAAVKRVRAKRCSMKCVRLLNYQTYKQSWALVESRSAIRELPEVRDGATEFWLYSLRLDEPSQRLLARLCKDPAVKRLLACIFGRGFEACHRMLEKYVPDTPM